MYENNLSITIEAGHPAYEWAKSQSDSVNAFGHIGTHIDCYNSEPSETEYEVSVVVVDCTDHMPSLACLKSLEITGKALVLFTGNIEKNNYGTLSYGEMDTTLTNEMIDEILSKEPAFIVIDSYGIGSHGDEHIRFDKKCESKSCFVIENVNLSHSIAHLMKKIHISIDKSSESTGKRCVVTALCA